MALANVISQLKVTAFSPAIKKSIRNTITHVNNSPAFRKGTPAQTTLLASEPRGWFALLISERLIEQLSKHFIERGSGRKNLNVVYG